MLTSSAIQQDPSTMLLTDQYQLTMAYAYWKNGMAEREAEFQMFYRKNPFHGGFAILAGVEHLIEHIQNFRFSQGDLDYLTTLKDRTGQPLFDDEFIKYLSTLHFECDVHAVAEGTVVFPNEPLLRVRGPILQAQILETPLLNTINFQSLIATKAARVCIAAQGDPVMDFGLRRAQGMNGAIAASRACYIGGCVGTSNVLAGKLMGIPVVGTHAHSWVMAFEEELQAFQMFARAMPNNCVFLVDTYGSINGIRNAIKIGQELRAQGHEMLGIRLDSGDLAYFSKRAREMLDAADMADAAVVASSELDEYVISSLKNQGAQIGVWGVGTKLVTAYDDPALAGVYKLSAIRNPKEEWDYKLKLSEQKAKMSIPGILQVHRYYDKDNKMMADGIMEVTEDPGQLEQIIDPQDNINRKKLTNAVRSEPLLKPLYEKGRLVSQSPTLESIRQRVQEQLNSLDESHKRFEYPHIYPVGLSPTLNQIRDTMIQQERDRLNENH